MLTPNPKTLTPNKVALTKEQKAKQVNAIKEKIAQQKSVVFIDFAKVPSAEMFSMRKALKEAGCTLKIAKKTLARIAFGQSNFSFWSRLSEVVPGQMAMVFGMEDEIAPARITNQFAKKQENLKILGGLFENRFIDRPRVLELANLPSRPELLGRMVGSIASSMTNFVRILDAIKQDKSDKS